jgi:hypothetical protein
MIRLTCSLAMIAVALASTIGIAQRPAAAQTAPTSGGPVDGAIIEDLVAANRILAQEGIVDAYGHVSIRHPSNPNRYLMSRSLAPILVTAGDILEYDLDSTPVDPRGRTSVLERFIHGEVYKARPDVNAVIHMQAVAISLGGPINYISPEEGAAMGRTPADAGRAWDLWRRKALGK